MEDNETAKAMWWLVDMEKFCKELGSFISALPAEAEPSEMGRIPKWASEQYKTLDRVSRECTYMSFQPASDLIPSIQKVQVLSRQAFVAVSQHPVFFRFQVENRVEPFFERAMIAGLSLAVEHQDALLKHASAEKDEN